MPSYRSTVDNWKQNNSSLEKPTNFDDKLKYFSTSCASFLSHPKVSIVSNLTQDRLLVLQLYKFLEFFIWAEQGLVIEVCKKMYAPTYFLKLSTDLVKGAQSICKQENNHSRWAYSLMLGVNESTDLVSFNEQPAFFDVMDLMIQNDPDLEELIRLFFVIISELLDFATAEIMCVITIIESL